MNHKMPFGADYSPNQTVFRLWAPRAVRVFLRRFHTGSEEEPGARFLGEAPMEDMGDGLFQCTIPGNLKNQYYEYHITDCTNAVTWSADPWALACGVNGQRSMVVDLAQTNPSGWAEDHGPEQLNAAPVIWEAHIRDFSNDPQSGVSEKNRGRYLAFTESNTTLDGSGVVPTCLNYLKQLGVTHIQLQPFFDYCTVDERHPESGYNWGYDPDNYNVPEGSYSSDPFHGAVRIRECKQMIQAIHKVGLGVIMDVVYNHTFRKDSWLQRTAPGSYYRYRKDHTMANASGCGTETASDRYPFREYMVESVCYWAEEYHIDGFRFDLMGIHDVQTMNLIRRRLDALPNGKRILTYGEPWAAQPPSMRQSAVPADKAAVKRFHSRLGFFCDDTRNLLIGSPFDVHKKGYAGGAAETSLAAQIKAAVHGWCDEEQLGYAKHPGQVLQYASCHDNYTLWDRLIIQQGIKDYNIPDAVCIQRNKLASGIYLTLPGNAFLQSGEEFARTKHGSGNSYNGPAELNQLDWARTEVFSDLISWYRGLLALRQELVPLERLKAANAKKIMFLDVPGTCTGFCMPGQRWNRLAVYYNPYEETQTVTLPRGLWQLLCDGHSSELWRNTPAVRNGVLTLEPLSVTILGKVQNSRTAVNRLKL